MSKLIKGLEFFYVEPITLINIFTVNSIPHIYFTLKGLALPAGPCSPGYYCTGGATGAKPIDGKTGNICPPGTYCGKPSFSALQGCIWTSMKVTDVSYVKFLCIIDGMVNLVVLISFRRGSEDIGWVATAERTAIKNERIKNMYFKMFNYCSYYNHKTAVILVDMLLP